MTSTIRTTTDLEVTECTCGVIFAIPARLLQQRREDGQTFYCPHGHRLSYKMSEVTRLRTQLDAARSIAAAERERRTSAERSASAARDQVTRIKKRIANGVCPCCQRTFVNVARHMASQHPEEFAAPK
jgi:type 1 glutamine amidotransferase